MKFRLRILSFILLHLFFFINFAHGAVSVGIGPEHFLWREYKRNGSQVLEESGFRGALRLNWEQDRSHGFLFGYSGKLYLGTVNYDGQTWGGTPVFTDTTYSGFQNEGSFILRQPITGTSIIDIITALGWDHWTRSIRNQNASQVEEYDILYLRLGPLFSFQGKRGPWLGAGGKVPLYTYENGHIDTIGFDQNPILHPGKQLWFYVNLGYWFNSKWEGTLYYDSYRFSESPQENVTQNGVPEGTVYQPQSSMDLIGIRGIYHLP